MEEPFSSKVEAHQSGVQDIVLGCLQRLNSPRLFRHSVFRILRIRTAVFVVLCISVVSLTYLASNLAVLHSSASPGAQPQHNSIYNLGFQRTVLSKSDPAIATARGRQKPLVQQLLANETLKHEPLIVDENASPSKRLGLLDFSPSEQFSLILQTYNRSDLLFRLLNHYCAMTNLDRAIVVWNNLNASPPVEEWEGLGPHPVPVRFVVQPENKIRNRLQPFPEIQTAAVLTVDDDLMISARDVQFAFRVWKQFPHLIVGFFPRKHVRSNRGFYSYGSFELDTGQGYHQSSFEYSMVLTGAAFVHKHYLRTFNDSSDMPKAVHRLVDELQNCEDIAFNMMVAQYLARVVGRPQCSGLYVKPIDIRNLEKDSVTGYVGMWHDPYHLAERSHCLNRLAEILGHFPLKYSDIMMLPMYTEAMKCPN